MSAIPGDVPWWTLKEPNFSRLQAAMCRREVILGTDEVLKLELENFTKQDIKIRRKKDEKKN